MSNYANFFRVVSILVLSSLLGGCMAAHAQQNTASSSRPPLSIYIVDMLGYTQPATPLDPTSAWKRLLAQKNDAIVYAITPHEIESYSWTEQTAVLTEDSSKQLHQAILERFGKQFGITNTEILMGFQLFAVFAGNTFIYSGTFTFQPSPLVISSPVGYMREDRGRSVISFRPFHTISQDYSKAPADWNGIKDEPIRQTPESAGKLR